MERQPHISTATLRGARAVGIVCAALFFAPVILSLAFPDLFLYAPYHRTYERMLGTILGALGIGLLLALRDPARNAGVFAVIGLTAGSLDAATIYSLVFDDAASSHWLTTVPLLAAIAVGRSPSSCGSSSRPSRCCRSPSICTTPHTGHL